MNLRKTGINKQTSVKPWDQSPRRVCGNRPGSQVETILAAAHQEGSVIFLRYHFASTFGGQLPRLPGFHPPAGFQFQKPQHEKITAPAKPGNAAAPFKNMAAHLKGAPDRGQIGFANVAPPAGQSQHCQRFRRQQQQLGKNQQQQNMPAIFQQAQQVVAVREEPFGIRGAVFNRLSSGLWGSPTAAPR